MAVKSLRVTLSGATQVSATSIKARWVVFENNAAAVMSLSDANVAAGQGIVLQAGGNNFAPPLGEQAMVHNLNQWYVVGTDTQVLDVVYDSVA